MGEFRLKVSFGSKADICAATGDVCFTPDSDRESGRADGHVCFTPESGRVQYDGLCLLWANSGHPGMYISPKSGTAARSNHNKLAQHAGILVLVLEDMAVIHVRMVGIGEV
jgi:hypothetical protein